MANQITPNPSVPSQVVQEVKFPQFVNNLGIIPTSYKDSMSYYETLTWLCKYLEETVIPTLNQNGNAVQELQGLYIELNEYVDHYFDTLDVQQEINNKLDEMATTGQLQELLNNLYDDLRTEVNAEINIIDNKVNSVTSGSPAGVYSTVSALESADPNHSKIYVVSANGKWYYYNTTNSEWTAGGTYLANDDAVQLKHYGATEIVPAAGNKITFSVSGNNVTVVTPSRLFAYIKNGANTFITIDLNTTSYVVENNELLVYDTTNNELVVCTQANFNLNELNYIILFWNNYGNIKGQWYKYYINQIAEDIKHYGSIDVVPTTLGKINFSISNNVITVTTPDTLFAFIKNNNDSFTRIQLSTTSFEIANNSLLVYDVVNNTISVINQTTFNASPLNYVLLVWNSYGNVKGQWYKYFVYQIADDIKHYGTIEITPVTQGKINFSISDNVITVTTPASLFAFIKNVNDSFKRIDLLTTEYEIANNNLLVYDINNNSLSVVSQTTFNNNPLDYVLLLWNNYGIVKGQWYKYFVENLTYSNLNNNMVDIVSRQGDNIGYPENTLEGVANAKKYGYNYVRVSFGWTSDGVAICCHNEYLYQSTLRNLDGTAISDQTLKLSDMTYEYIEENYDAGIYRGSNFAGITVPTVEQIIKQCKKLGQKIDIEYKFGYSTTNMLNLLTLIYKYGVEDNIVLSVYDTTIADYVKASDYPIKIGLIRNLTSENVTTVINGQYDRMDIYASDTYDDTLITLLHKNNIKVKVGSAYDLTSVLDFINKYDIIECGTIRNPIIDINNS